MDRSDFYYKTIDYGMKWPIPSTLTIYPISVRLITPIHPDKPFSQVPTRPEAHYPYCCKVIITHMSLFHALNFHRVLDCFTVRNWWWVRNEMSLQSTHTRTQINIKPCIILIQGYDMIGLLPSVLYLFSSTTNNNGYACCTVPLEQVLLMLHWKMS